MKIYLNGELKVRRRLLPTAAPSWLTAAGWLSAVQKTDGSQFGDINYPPAGYTSSAGGWFTLGAYHDANEYYPLNGMQDDTRLWNVARSAEEIMASYGSLL